MQHAHSWTARVRYYTSLSLVYIMTISLGWFALHPIERPKTQLVSISKAQQKPVAPALRPQTISGKPIRIVIPASGIDLPLDEGYYDSSTGQWTLGGYRAQFAMMSSLANNESGDTFVYGHNNNYVFGALRHNTPEVGSQALLYTDNGHVFSYTFQSATSLTPDDTTALQYQGPPILTIQTCTGSFNEWRTLFRFNFEKVVS